MADRIVVLAEGTVEAAGTHEELLQQQRALRGAVRAAGGRLSLMGTRVAVIGAGVVGLACASSCRCRATTSRWSTRVRPANTARSATPAASAARSCVPLGLPGPGSRCPGWLHRSRRAAVHPLRYGLASRPGCGDSSARRLDAARGPHRRCAARAADRDARQMAPAGRACRRARADRSARLRVRVRKRSGVRRRRARPRDPRGARRADRRAHGARHHRVRRRAVATAHAPGRCCPSRATVPIRCACRARSRTRLRAGGARFVERRVTRFRHRRRRVVRVRTDDGAIDDRHRRRRGGRAFARAVVAARQRRAAGNRTRLSRDGRSRQTWRRAFRLRRAKANISSRRWRKACGSRAPSSSPGSTPPPDYRRADALLVKAQRLLPGLRGTNASAGWGIGRRCPTRCRSSAARRMRPMRASRLATVMSA